MAKKAKEKVIDPSTGKPIRAPRVPLSPEDKNLVVAERVKLGRMLSNNDLPASVQGEAVKLLGLGTTQLLRRLQKANS